MIFFSGSKARGCFFRNLKKEKFLGCQYDCTCGTPHVPPLLTLSECWQGSCTSHSELFSVIVPPLPCFIFWRARHNWYIVPLTWLGWLCQRHLGAFLNTLIQVCKTWFFLGSLWYLLWFRSFHLISLVLDVHGKFLYHCCRLVSAQDVHFFYTRSHLSALQNCALLFSTNFQFIFIFKKCITQFSHWIV